MQVSKWLILKQKLITFVLIYKTFINHLIIYNQHQTFNLKFQYQQFSLHKLTSLYLCVTVLLLSLQIAQSINQCKPFGVRLSFGKNIANFSSEQKLAIRFNTKDPCQKCYVNLIRSGSSIKKIYCDNFRLSFDNYTTYVHKCSIVDISESETIEYLAFGWTGNISDSQIPYSSTPISYYLPKKSEQFKFVSLADWSYLREFRTKYKPLDQSFDYLLSTDNKIRALFINGDIAYDLQSNNGRNYEDFMNMISQVSIKWPVIVNPGNHQHRDNNSYILNASFQVYGIVESRVVLLSLPWFNFILFDPYEILYNKEPQNKSYPDFRKQLESSYKQKNLTVLASHYPFRCNGQEKDCQTKHKQMSNFFGAMFEFNVPLYLGAHFHAYERHFPFKPDGSYIKTSKISWDYDRKDSQRLLVSIVEGSGGNDLSMVQEYDQLRDFTAGYSYNVTGYAIVTVNEFRLSYSHYSSNNPMTPIDYFEMTLKRQNKKELRTE